jgi:hypothetical protein
METLSGLFTILIPEAVFMDKGETEALILAKQTADSIQATENLLER